MRRRRGSNARDERVKKRLVLFDVDGTLLLSGGAGRRAILKALEDEAGIDPTLVDSVRFDGKTDPQIVIELFATAGQGDRCDAGWIDRVITRYLGHLEADLALTGHRASVMPGVVALLEALGEDGRVVLGLLTGNVSRGAEIKLRAVGIEPERFRVGAFGSDHSLRSALPLIAALRAQPIFGRSVLGREVVIIGDTPADVTCGQGIGARAIGVATGSFTTGQLAAAGAEAVFADLAATELVHSTILGAMA